LSLILSRSGEYLYTQAILCGNSEVTSMVSGATVDPNKPTTDQWIELAKLAQQNFQNRRALEWKLAFGFWTAIASLTAVFLLNKLDRPSDFPSMLAACYGVAWILSLLCWMLPLQIAHAGDKAYWLFYLDKAQGGNKPAPGDAKTLSDNLRRLTANSWLWLVGQAAFTLVFLSLSWYAIAFIVPAPSSGQAPVPVDADRVALTPALISSPSPSSSNGAFALDLGLRVFSALFVPTVAAIAAYIAWRQFRTASDKLRLDLYDRRFQVYRGVMDLLTAISNRDTVTAQELGSFYTSTDQKRFLFALDLCDFLKVIREKAGQMGRLSELIGDERTPEPRRATAIDEKLNLVSWFDALIDGGEVPRRFEPYLGFRRNF
jgi:hypothetical protein